MIRRFDERQDDQRPPPQQRPHGSGSSTGGANTPLEGDLQQANNLSTSTLRRKLFEGMIDDDDDSDSAGEGMEDDENKENEGQQQQIMSSPICTREAGVTEQLSSPPDGGVGNPSSAKLSSPLRPPLAITPINKLTRIADKNVS